MYRTCIAAIQTPREKEREITQAEQAKQRGTTFAARQIQMHPPFSPPPPAPSLFQQPPPVFSQVNLAHQSFLRQVNAKNLG
jgi:hypothetical protein